MKTIINIIIYTLFVALFLGSCLPNSNVNEFNDNLSRKLVKYDESDTINKRYMDFNKTYRIDFEGVTQNNQFLDINHAWLCSFEILRINRKSYFVPDALFFSGNIDHSSSLGVKVDYSINLMRDEAREVYYEIEICYYVNNRTVRSRSSSSGITVTSGKGYYASDIFDLLSQDNHEEVGLVEIKSKERKGVNDICRKIKVQSKDFNVHFTEVSSQNLDSLGTPFFKSRQINESGNLLDTLEIKDFIWTNFAGWYNTEK